MSVTSLCLKPPAPYRWSSGLSKARTQCLLGHQAPDGTSCVLCPVAGPGSTAVRLSCSAAGQSHGVPASVHTWQKVKGTVLGGMEAACVSQVLLRMRSGRGKKNEQKMNESGFSAIQKQEFFRLYLRDTLKTSCTQTFWEPCQGLLGRLCHVPWPPVSAPPARFCFFLHHGLCSLAALPGFRVCLFCRVYACRMFCGFPCGSSNPLGTIFISSLVAKWPGLKDLSNPTPVIHPVACRRWGLSGTHRSCFSRNPGLSFWWDTGPGGRWANRDLKCEVHPAQSWKSPSY
jgi:hypothetical protein